MAFRAAVVKIKNSHITELLWSEFFIFQASFFFCISRYVLTIKKNYDYFECVCF